MTLPGRGDSAREPRAAEVAVQPVRASAHGRRSRVIVVAVIALAVGLTGVALAGRLNEERRIAPGPSAAAEVAVASSPRSPSPSTSANLRLTGRVLPTIPSRPLAGTPALMVWRRDGDDLVILEWNPAEPARPLRPSRRVPGLLRGIPDAQILVGLSPTGRRISLGAFVPRASSTSREIVRVATLSGHVLWHADLAAPSLVTPTWTPGRDELIVPVPGRWSLVSLAADRVTAGSIRVPTFQREPFGGTLDPVVPQIAAFSGDGRSAYAAAIDSPFGLGLRPLFLVDLDQRSARKLSALPGALADTPSLGGSAATGRVDPGTGRVFGLPPPGGSVVRIFAGDGITQTARIQRPRVLGATWVRGGNLALLSTNEASPAVDGTRLELIDPNGDATRTLLTTDAVPGGALLPGPTGTILVALGSPNGVELIVVRLADGATASTVVSSRDLAGAGILDWRPVPSP